MEKLFRQLAQMSASFVFLILIAVVGVLYLTAKPAIQEFGAHFVVDSRWGVEVPISAEEQANKTTLSTEEAAQAAKADAAAAALDAGLGDDMGIDDDDEDSGGLTKTVYGGAVPIIGTLFSTLIAMLFSIPIAMGIAIFLSEIASDRLSQPVGVAIELLAAIPSIIYGMWGLFYFGPFVASVFGGNTVSLLVAGLVLGVMVIPFMAALSRDAINTTPDILKESAYAMGATKFEVVKDIIFPYAKAGIIGSIIISLGRALGETMAVAFVIGGVYQFAQTITSPTNSIPVVLANNFSESSGISMSALFYLALVLFVVSFVVIFFAKYYFLRRNK